MNWLTHIWVEVHWIYKVYLWILLTEVLHGGDHADEAVAEILTSMAGDEDEFLTAIKAGDVITGIKQYLVLLLSKNGIGVEFVNDHVEGIDHGIAGDIDIAVDFLLLQILLGEWGRREVIGGNASGDLTIHLLGPRAVDIVRTETSLNVPHRNLCIKSGQGCDGGGSSIAMNEDYIGAAFFEHVAPYQ